MVLFLCPSLLPSFLIPFVLSLAFVSLLIGCSRLFCWGYLGGSDCLCDFLGKQHLLESLSTFLYLSPYPFPSILYLLLLLLCGLSPSSWPFPAGWPVAGQATSVLGVPVAALLLGLLADAAAAVGVAECVAVAVVLVLDPVLPVPSATAAAAAGPMGSFPVAFAVAAVAAVGTVVETSVYVPGAGTVFAFVGYLASVLFLASFGSVWAAVAAVAAVLAGVVLAESVAAMFAISAVAVARTP